MREGSATKPQAQDALYMLLGGSARWRCLARRSLGWHDLLGRFRSELKCSPYQFLTDRGTPVSFFLCVAHFCGDKIRALGQPRATGATQRAGVCTTAD